MVWVSLLPVIGSVILLYSDRVILVSLGSVCACLGCSSLVLLTNELTVGGWLIILTTLVYPLALISTIKIVRYDLTLYYGGLLVLESILLNVFISEDLITFYSAFELSLVPLFILVSQYGGESRYRASYLLFLYTLGGSVFILLAFSYLVVNSGTTSIELLSLIGIELPDYIFLGLLVSLMVKTPIVPFHVWLPRAHAEANLAGSILLAGVVLKLATFGFVKVVLPIISWQSSYYSNLIITVSLVSIVLSSLSAVRITDVKGLVAVSSVAHMSIVVLGLFSNTIEGIEGGLILSIAHGFISPAAFFCVGGVIYKRYQTRELAYYSGLGYLIPLFSGLLFLTMCGNIGVPLSLNFLGELLAVIGVFESKPLLSSISASSILLSACYSLYLYNRVTAGSYSHKWFTLDVTRLEWNVTIPLLGLTLVTGVVPSTLIDSMALEVTKLLY